MKKFLYVIALIAGILGIVASFVSIPFVTSIASYLVMGGFVVLALGYLIKK